MVSTSFLNSDLIPFLAGIAVLILYLVFSALTEMGTKWPQKKISDRSHQIS